MSEEVPVAVPYFAPPTGRPSFSDCRTRILPKSVSHRARRDTDRFGTPFKVPEEYSETTTAILDTSLRLWGLAITTVCGWVSEILFARIRIATRVSSNLGNIAFEASSGIISAP